MVVGAFWSIVRTRNVIGRGIRQALINPRGARGAAADRTQRDLPMSGVLLALGLTAVGTFILMRVATDSTVVGLVSTMVVVALVFAVAAVSGYTVGLVGNSNNPISALAVCGFLVAGLLFALFGFHGPARLTTSVLLVSAFICTASAVAGDTAQHLKTGALVGATPYRQQLAQLIGVTAFAFVVAPIVVLLVRGYGLGTDDPHSLKAPQAVLFANLADTVFGDGGLPTKMLWIGAAAAIGVIVVDSLLKRRGSSFRLSVMPFAIGMYLPVSLTLPIFVGALLPIVLRRATRAHGPDVTDETQDRSMLLWAGLITGEALVGVGNAVPLWLGWRLPVRLIDSPVLSLVVFGLILVLVLHFSLNEGVQRTWWRRSVHHDGRK
jgi:putative OPT family oligopeptide transporter